MDSRMRNIVLALLAAAILLTAVHGNDESSPSPPPPPHPPATFATEVPSTAINNQNVTNSTSAAITEAATTTDEHQLKLSTPEPSTTATTEAQQQPQASSDEAAAVSFGIRSFTVEVSKSEKVPTTTTVPQAVITESEASTVAIETRSTSQPSSQSLDALKSNLNILFSNGDGSATDEENRGEASSSRENEISNEIQIDRKLDNGLYRIKIGEITTDEFSNGMSFGEDEERAKDKLHREQAKMKVNIDDFFPSKLEDFGPIIEISNEKMIKEKDLLHGTAPTTTQQAETSEEAAERSGTRINTANVATTNIEIELIDESTASGGSSKGIEIDEIITQVEEIATELPLETATKVNVGDTFIPRRTKKFDPASNTQGPTRIHDFGMTKFNQRKENATQSQVNGKPEYSTTKFYNSKELYNEILHKSSKPLPPGAATTVSPPPPPQTKPTVNLIREKLLNTNKIPIEAPHIAMTTRHSFEADIATTTVGTSTTIARATTTTTTTTVRPFVMPTNHPRILSRLEEKLNSLDCDIQNLSADSTVWRGNETHELNLPITTPEDCSSGTDCLPMIISWEGSVDIQSGDVLIVEIDDKLLVSSEKRNKTFATDEIYHRNSASVYQVTRLGHEHCDITEGELLDITPLVVDGKKLVTLYDKDLTEGINLLIVVSELWDQQCVRLRVNVKSDNCGENADCSGKGICFSNASMESFFCECCTGFAGQHCEEIDACTPSPCTNNGICVDLSQGHEGNSYQCLCPYGYTGKNCQFEADPCNPSQCLNGGTCISNTTHFRNANSTFPFRCECPPGFTGPLCQHNLNECESSPCVHGICVDQEDGFRCFCQPGFSGDLCNFEYNECDSNPCVNGGQCIDHIGGFSCQCTKGYQGKRCHIKIDFCANNPCEDGYRCVDHGDEYSCVCPGSSDHNVPDCHDVPRTLCSVNPCANGGTCWTSNESFYCACRPGFTGKMCEDDFVIDTVVSSSELLSDVSSDTSNVITWGELKDITQDASSTDVHNAYVAAGILAAALLILAIVVTICHCKVNGTYRRFSVNQRQLIPFFLRRGTGKKSTVEDEQSKHWLSGKNSSFFEENHINLKNNQQTQPQHSQHCPSNSLFNNRPLQMNLENDMYYTVDFSDSQQSPLIQ